jgi:hypothetical protein
MSGKHLVFLKEVTSPVFGHFNAGDVGKNIDAAFAADMIGVGVAKETSSATAQADSDAAASAAGRITKTIKGQRNATETSFSPSEPMPNRTGDAAAAAPAAAAAAAPASEAPKAAAKKAAPARKVADKKAAPAKARSKR